MVTGSGIYQELNDGTLAERGGYNGQTTLLLLAKTTDDSRILVSPVNGLVPNEYDYVNMMYSGTNLMQATFRVGGASGTVLGTLNMTYDSIDNLLTVKKT